MNKDIAEACDRGKGPGELRGQNAQFTHPHDRIMIIYRFPGLLKRNDTVTNINAALCGHFKVPVMICINKYDLNLENSARIEKLACADGYPVVGRVPFDPVFTRAMIQGQTLFEFDGNGPAGQQLKSVWDAIIHHPVMT